MSAFRKALAVILLLAILPATLHCALDNVGLIEADQCCSTAAGGEDEDCADYCDNSKVFRFQKDDTIKLAPVIALTQTPFCSEPLADAGTIGRRDVADTEPERPWQFVQRAAPLARSPSIPA